MNDSTPEATDPSSASESSPTEFPGFIPRTGPLQAAFAFHLLAFVAVLVMGPSALISRTLFPVVTASICLIAIWLSLGQARLVYRLGGTLAYCGSLLLTTFRDPEFAIVATILVGMRVVCVAAPLFVVATLGFAISTLEPAKEPLAKYTSRSAIWCYGPWRSPSC